MATAPKTRKPTTGGVIIGSSYDEARTRKMNADAEIAELELEKIRGTLCLTTDVVSAWESVLHACKTKFLALPSKISPVVASETDTGIVKQYLEDQIREALSELANYNPSVDPIHTATASGEPVGDDEKADTAPKTKRGRVGRPRKATRLSK